jgi:hypothetical protein
MLGPMAMRRLACLVIVAACGSTESLEVDPNDPLPPPPDGVGVQVATEIEVQPGEEIWLCRVLDLPNERFFPINHAESVQNDGMHHMDLIATALATSDLEPGDYDCEDVYAQYPNLMEDGIIIYASQQKEQEIVLPAGTVANLLPHMRVMHEIHFVNPTDQPIKAFSKINAYEYKDDFDKEIWGGAVRDLDINVPANTAQHVEWTRCVMNQDVDVLFLSTHTHALAKETVVRRFDGQAATGLGEILYTNTDWHAPHLKDLTQAPLHVPAGSGFEFECNYENHSGAPVHWGFTAAEEMCQIALVYTPGEAKRHCDIVASGVR